MSANAAISGERSRSRRASAMRSRSMSAIGIQVRSGRVELGHRARDDRIGGTVGDLLGISSALSFSASAHGGAVRARVRHQSPNTAVRGRSMIGSSLARRRAARCGASRWCVASPAKRGSAATISNAAPRGRRAATRTRRRSCPRAARDLAAHSNRRGSTRLVREAGDQAGAGLGREEAGAGRLEADTQSAGLALRGPQRRRRTRSRRGRGRAARRRRASGRRRGWSARAGRRRARPRACAASPTAPTATGAGRPRPATCCRARRRPRSSAAGGSRPSVDRS